MKIWLPCEFGEELGIEYLFKMRSGWFVGVVAAMSFRGNYAWHIQTNINDIRAWIEWDHVDLQEGKQINLMGHKGRWIEMPFSFKDYIPINHFGCKDKILKLISIQYDLITQKYKYQFMDTSGRTSVYHSDILELKGEE